MFLRRAGPGRRENMHPEMELQNFKKMFHNEMFLISDDSDKRLLISLYQNESKKIRKRSFYRCRCFLHTVVYFRMFCDFLCDKNYAKLK